jgi:hypothetical protein
MSLTLAHARERASSAAVLVRAESDIVSEAERTPPMPASLKTLRRSFLNAIEPRARGCSLNATVLVIASEAAADALRMSYPLASSS